MYRKAYKATASSKRMCCFLSLCRARLFPTCSASHMFGCLHTYVNKHQWKSSYLLELFVQWAACASVEGVIVYKRSIQSQLFKNPSWTVSNPPSSSQFALSKRICVCASVCVCRNYMAGEPFQSGEWEGDRCWQTDRLQTGRETEG